jgi:hypothetical protein
MSSGATVDPGLVFPGKGRSTGAEETFLGKAEMKCSNQDRSRNFGLRRKNVAEEGQSRYTVER